MIYLERFDDKSGNVRLLNPTIIRRIVNNYSDMDVRIIAGDTYGIDCRGTKVGNNKIIGVDIVGYEK